MRASSVVDSQCHVSSIWYEPVEVLLGQMDRYAVDRAVLIQMLGQTDNSYQQQCLRTYPERFASVVLVDTEAPDALSQLSRLADGGASGVRLRPTARSPGSDPLAIWRHAAECALTISCVGNSGSFASPEFAHLIAQLPTLPIVLEHLAGTSQPDADADSRAARARALELARFPNVYLKVPGLGELVARVPPGSKSAGPFESGCPAVLDEAIHRFGPERLMWGSDFPPVSAREGYGNALAFSREAVAERVAPEQVAWIFGGLAAKLFKLR